MTMTMTAEGVELRQHQLLPSFDLIRNQSGEKVFKEVVLLQTNLPVVVLTISNDYTNFSFLLSFSVFLKESQ